MNTNRWYHRQDGYRSNPVACRTGSGCRHGAGSAIRGQSEQEGEHEVSSDGNRRYHCNYGP